MGQMISNLAAYRKDCTMEIIEVTTKTDVHNKSRKIIREATKTIQSIVKNLQKEIVVVHNLFNINKVRRYAPPECRMLRYIISKYRTPWCEEDSIETVMDGDTVENRLSVAQPVLSVCNERCGQEVGRTVVECFRCRSRAIDCALSGRTITDPPNHPK